MIGRFAVRELRHSRLRTFLITLITALTVNALVGGIVASLSLYHTRDHYYHHLRFMDLEISFLAASDAEMPPIDELRKIEGVASVERRFLTTGYIELPQGEALLVLVIYLDPSHPPYVNDIEITAGRFLDPDDPKATVVDRTFFEIHHLRLGSKLIVNPDIFPMEFHVEGVGISPEFLLSTPNPNILMPAKGSLGVLFANRAVLDQTFIEPLYNDLLFRFEATSDPQATRARILDALDSLEIVKVTPRKQQFAYVFIKEDLEGFLIFTPVVGMILAAIGAIVLIVTLSRLIFQRQREIGTLMAHGFTKSQIARAFFKVALLPGLVGAVVGLGISVPFAQLLGKSYAHSVGLPAILMTYPPLPILGGALFGLLLTLAGALLPLLKILRMKPIEAIRREGSIHFRGLPDFIDRWLHSAKAGTRLGFRNAFRRPQLSVASIVLVALALSLPSALNTETTSWKEWAKRTVESAHWDATVDFKVPLEGADFKPIVEAQGIAEAEPYLVAYASVKHGQLPENDIRLVGLPVPETIHHLDLVEGRTFSAADAREIILNLSFRQTDHKPFVGEKVEVRGGERTEEFTVVGLISDMNIGTAFVPIGTVRELIGEPDKTSGAYLRFDRSEEAQAMKSKLLKHPNVASVTILSDVTDALVEYLENLTVILDPMLAMSVLMSGLFLLSVIGILIREREMEYATLRCIGFESREICRIILTELLLLVIGATIGSIPLWGGLSRMINALSGRAWFPVGIKFVATDFLKMAIPALLFLPLAALPAIRHILRSNLTETLRNWERG